MQAQERLHSFTLSALGHATSGVVPDGGPLIPFALTEGADGRLLQRFVGELGAMQEAARQIVRGMQGLELAAVAWDGYLTVDGQRTDAVFVEASDGSGDPSVLLAQCYAKAGRFRRATATVGEPILVERRTPLFVS
jgi:hypothetical protein